VADDDFAKKLARLAAAPDSPFAKTLREIADSPLAQRMRALSEAPVPEAWRNLANSDLVKAAQLLNPSSSAFQSLMRTDEVRRLSERYDKFMLAANSPEVQQLVKRASEWQIASRAFLTPPPETVSKLAMEASRIVDVYRATSAANDWNGRLARMMSQMNTPWAIEGGLSVSAAGFARIVRLSDAAHGPTPFAEPVAEMFAAELGSLPAEMDAPTAARDAAAVEAGLQADLIAFPPAGYGGIVFTAGFRFNVVGLPTPQAIEAGDPDAVYDPSHNTVLTSVERHLRHTVETKLVGLDGAAWVNRRVPEGVRKRWAERQNEDRQLGRPVYGLIHYADFMDLADVITQGANWREAFGAIFCNSEDLRVALHRLHPVRKALSHSRPLCRADVLTLVAEATRILKALGIDMLA
jgi:hypothetical protein